MNLDKVFVADIETKGLLDRLNSFEDFHVLSIGFKNKEGNWNITSTNKKEDVQKFFGNKDNIIVMHNGIRYDKPALEKMGITVNATIIDTLPLAWNLYSTRSKEGKKFGLEAFGEDYGIPKPKVTDWENLTYDEYKHRCQEDVSINITLWEKLYAKGKLVYEDNPQDFIRLINILGFIMECVKKQEEEGLYVDILKTQHNLDYFEKLKDEKVEELKAAMPRVPVKTVKKVPKTLYKKDGSYSVAGAVWVDMLTKLKLPLDYTGDIEVIKEYKDPNPNSVDQKKDWLFANGWKPQTIKRNRNKDTGEVKEVVQILGTDGMLCPSVLKLSNKIPEVVALDGLTVLTHRIGVLKGFLKNCDENGMIVQGLKQLAVTMRWQHSKVVNINRVTGKGDIKDGVWLRECLIPKKGSKIVQADLSGIESRTSDHYTFHINPDRIKKTQMPFFDPHTEIAVFAGLMTSDEETFYIFKAAHKDDPSLDVRTFSELYKYTEGVQALLDLPEDEQKTLLQKLKNSRSAGKTTNYSSLYLVGATTLSKTLEIPKKEAEKLIESYWKIHYAVLKFTESLETKKVGEETWVYNPISKFWYFVRNSKDLFSTINQSSAVYCFNMWVYFISKKGFWAHQQSHDDLALSALDNEEDISKVRQAFHSSMDDLNKYLKLNVALDCESQVGDNLAETH